MGAISDYFAANPAAFTLLAIAVVFVILYSLLGKFIKFAIVLIVVVVLASWTYISKDPEAVKKSTEMFKAGGTQIAEKLKSFWTDTKELADKSSQFPKDVNKMLNTAKDQATKK